jgi:hypothetical protein
MPEQRATSPARCAALALLLTCAGCAEFLPPAPAAPEAAPDPAVALLERELAACRADLDAERSALEALQVGLSAQGEAIGELRRAVERVEAAAAAETQPVVLPAPQACAAIEADLADKLLVGRRENVWIEDLQLAVPARIDTGAETASLDARNIEEFERDGEAWVRFEIVHPEGGEALLLEKPLARTVRILQSTSEEPERRAVVELGIVLGPVRQLAEFTLSDRSHLDYQMLVGRNILRDLMIVDVSQVNIAERGGDGPDEGGRQP